jgi:acetaldehyde dehydrogenase / alcohol dehydrogenase
MNATKDKTTSAGEMMVDACGKAAAEELDNIVKKAKAAQKAYSSFSQEKVDAIFRAAALAASAARLELAKDAVAETGMGIVEDKVIKNHFASEFIYAKYKDVKTCGVIERDEQAGIAKIAEPVGLIAGIIPTTNPTSTAVFKALLALKTRNGIILSPHPRARKCTVKAARIVLEAAVAAGAPEGIIGWLADPTVELSNLLMKHPGIDLILATGGPGMVKAAYASGKPALGVGAGNTPAVVDETADIGLAASSIIISKTFDNGVICASEQSVIAVDAVYGAFRAEFERRGARVLSGEERRKLAAVLVKDGRINAAIVGRSAADIAKMAGFDVDPATKILVVETEAIGAAEPFSQEKLSPVLALYRAKDYREAAEKALALVEYGGLGHTAVLYTDPANRERIDDFASKLKAGRILVNAPSSQGAIGDIYNFRLEPSLTLGCGSWGGNSVSENVGVKQLLNVKTVAERRDNMLWFRVPPKIYLKRGCLPIALADLKAEGRARAFIVTDEALARMGAQAPLTRALDALGIAWEIFSDIQPDPTMAAVREGLARLAAFAPDAIIAFGGGSPIDAAKVMWLMREEPGVEFKDLAARFMDIRKRIYRIGGTPRKIRFVAVPTTSGTGSEVTPFAVVTDETTGQKYPLADYALTPDMAICDADLAMGMPRGLTAASGIDALSHAVEAIASVMATDYSSSLAMEAARLVFRNLPEAYGKLDADSKARENMHNASTMAGMAFANAFLGVCHSMAHKLGAAYRIPHGVANALMLPYVIRFNAAPVPAKQAIFSQYAVPEADKRYARLASYLGLSGEDDAALVDALIGAVRGLCAQIGIKPAIKDYGVDEKDFLNGLDLLAERAFDDQCTGTNPRYPLIAEIKEMYRKAYYGEDA